MVSTREREGAMNRKKICQENGGRNLTGGPHTKEAMRTRVKAGAQGVELKECRRV